MNGCLVGWFGAVGVVFFRALALAGDLCGIPETESELVPGKCQQSMSSRESPSASLSVSPLHCAPSSTRRTPRRPDPTRILNPSSLLTIISGAELPASEQFLHRSGLLNCCVFAFSDCFLSRVEGSSVILVGSGRHQASNLACRKDMLWEY